MVPAIAEVIDVVSAKRTARKFDGSGCCCQFFKVTKTWAAKLYYDEDTRDECFENQFMASRAGLAPQVGHQFEIVTKERACMGHEMNAETGEYELVFAEIEVHQYGFTTEVCPYIAFDVWESCKKHKGSNDWRIGCECDKCKFEDNTESVVEELRCGMSAIGLTFNDSHRGNWGWMDKPFGDKPVIIDFSESQHSDDGWDSENGSGDEEE